MVRIPDNNKIDFIDIFVDDYENDFRNSLFNVQKIIIFDYNKLQSFISVYIPFNILLFI